MGNFFHKILYSLGLLATLGTILGFVSLSALPALAQTVESNHAATEVSDPLEPVNRVVFKFNDFFQDAVLGPLASIYTLVLPNEGRKAVHNFLKNLKAPLTLANDLLQGEMDRAWVTTKRFSINTTIGVGGILDVANEWGIKHHSEDAGQTLAVIDAMKMENILRAERDSKISKVFFKDGDNIAVDDIIIEFT